MDTDYQLRLNLIADVENICEINMDEETKVSLMRAFEITLGCNKEYSPFDLNILDALNAVKERGISIIVVGGGHDLVDTSKGLQELKKDRFFDIEPNPVLIMPFVEKKPKGHIRPYKYHK